ncbi:MAG TPA: DNA adenine methylase [Hyphomicrobiales bacterium]|nr:DNA adenine methylase [Hyphomicrobiales bacterium]
MTAQPLFPWIGGKRKLAGSIIPLFPDHQCYVEPFCGAGGMFFSKPESPSEVLNDINHDVFNLFRVVKHHFEALYLEFKWALSSREYFQTLQRTPPDTLTDIQRAARFLYLQKLAFGGKVKGQTFGASTTSRPKFNLLTLEHDLQEVHFRLSAVTLERKPWAEIVEAYDRPHTLFYCDPPYWDVEGYGVEFPIEQYIEMATLATTIQGRMIISINGHPKMREVFRALPCREFEYSYTVAAGDQRTDCVELVFGNWEGGKAPRPREIQAGLFG